jgi:acyl phosphate:glycerol-3-phosphate acyltransferase
MEIDHELLQVILIVVTSYLLGSFPTAYVIGRLNKINIFEVGSGNMGGTNAARAMGCGWGLLVLVLDMTKGIIAISLARVIMSENTIAAAVISAIVVIVGHNWSLFVALITGTLRGGKGAATAFGTMLMIAPIQVIAAVCVIGAVLVALTRYVSLGVLVMLAVAATWMTVLVVQHAIATEYAIYTFGVAGMMLWRFRENIQRLLEGKERRLGERT